MYNLIKEIKNLYWFFWSVFYKM